MQGKGIIRFFLVVMAIVCAIQYLLILPTRKVEKRAESYAQSKAASIGNPDSALIVSKVARISYLDSMSSEEVFRIPLIKSYTYEELKRQQLALGLDLKGGMSVVLKVDLEEFVRSLSGESKDPTFQEALANAKKASVSTQSDFISLFGQEFSKIAGEKRLASIFSRHPTLRDQINLESSNAEVLAILRTSANETVDLTFKRLKDRIDKLGVVQPNVSLDAARDLILVELPGIDNPERARSFLQSAAKLEFWDVYRVSDPGLLNAFVEADAVLKRITSGDTTSVDTSAVAQVQYDTIWKPALDSLGNATGDSTYEVVESPVLQDPFSDRGPLLSNLDLNVATSEGMTAFPLAVFGVVDENKKNLIDQYLSMPEVLRLFPADAFFRWSQKPYKDIDGNSSGRYQLYVLKKKRGSDSAPLTGERVIRANSQPDPISQEVQVSLAMDNQGARIWGDMTTKAAQDNNREIAIVLDDEVVSAPGVNEPITSGDSQISGDFTIQEGKDLANILQIGKLPATTRIIQDAVVGPSLGKDNIQRSMISLIAGFMIVIVFMALYYAGAGLVSIIALLANLVFIFGALASYGTVLTLPGFAGIILTIGMAVDANVVIFERVREELRTGKSLAMSITDGFRNSYSAIIDANVTTVLTALVLSYFGIGPIKGFAVVLIIGVIFSLFTAVLMSRLIIEWWLGKGKSLSFWTPSSKNMFANLNIDWVGKRKIAFVISGVIILAGLISMFTRGFDLGVDFKGGHAYTLAFEQSVSVSAPQLRTELQKVFGTEPVVKSVDTENTFNIVTSYMVDSEDPQVDEMVVQKLYEGISQITGVTLDPENFRNPDGTGTHITSSSKVGPLIADDIRESSVYATILALLGIFLYILIRFSRWQYSAGAVLALFHDALIMLSVFSLLHGIVPWTMEVDQNFIAAILTIMGYSINDTVIIFDRIREFLGNYTHKTKTELINSAINSTISRTIITSLTTLLVVLVLFLFGGASIKGFAFALVIGIISGTYSTVFIAAPILHDFTAELEPKDVSHKKHFSKAVKA